MLFQLHVNQSGSVDANSPPATVTEVDFFKQHEEFSSNLPQETLPMEDAMATAPQPIKNGNTKPQPGSYDCSCTLTWNTSDKWM